MKKLIVLIFIGSLFAQITSIKITSPSEEIEQYDSTLNFLGKDVYKYIGQELYLNEKNESLREYGYEGFVKNYNKELRNKKNIYKCCDGYNSKYDELAAKYFSVINVHKDPKSSFLSAKFFLELKEKDSGNIVYYTYSSRFKHSFPFLVVGYFTKQKEFYIGKEFIIKGRNWLDDTKHMYDVNTGEIVSFETGSRWRCVDFTIESKYYSLTLILENEKGERIRCSPKSANSIKNMFYAQDVDKYIQKFGEKNWDIIFKGEVLIGFTEEMVIASWGKPKKINKSSSGDQWVYNDRYLYFENGLLKSYN
jgi:hypothetical protein